MLVVTLDRMADGGIHDQVGGGFHRYATDGTWHVPHFEKMLYDNAQLAQLYTRAWLVTRNDRYRHVATRTLEYLLREMQHAEGGFFSSQDADSEGVEGRFFAWTWDELVAVAGEPAARAFGALPDGNWEGTNVLWRAGSRRCRPRGRAARRCSRCARRVCGPAPTTRSSRRGTRWRSARSRRPAGRSTSRPTSTPRSRCADVRLAAPSRRARPAAADVAQRRRRRGGVRRRSRAARRRAADAVRDDVGSDVVPRGARALRRAGGAVRRRGAGRLLPDRARRGPARRASEGPVRQRGAERELGRGRDAPAARALHRRGAVRARRGRRRSASFATRCKARPRASGTRSARSTSTSGRPARSRSSVGSTIRRPSLCSTRSSGAAPPERCGRGGWPRRRSREPGRPSASGRSQIERRPTAFVCQRFACLLPVISPDVLRRQLAD